MKSASIILLLLTVTAALLAKEPPNASDPTAPHPNVAPALVQIDKVVLQGPFTPTWESLSRYEIPQWYQDAKFGIFIHWGVYSVPAFGSEWYPRQMYIDAERRGDNFFQHHRVTYGPQSTFGYKDFIPHFKAEKFDPDAWAKLFQEFGAAVCRPGRGAPRRLSDVCVRLHRVGRHGNGPPPRRDCRTEHRHSRTRNEVRRQQSSSVQLEVLCAEA